MNQSESSQDESSVFPILINSLTDDSGQIQFCPNLNASLYKRGNSPCKSEFPEVKIRRQIIDHYLKEICNVRQQYGIYTIEISTPSKFHGKHLIQTDDIDKEFSIVFTDYIKNKHIRTQKGRIQN